MLNKLIVILLLILPSCKTTIDNPPKIDTSFEKAKYYQECVNRQWLSRLPAEIIYEHCSCVTEQMFKEFKTYKETMIHSSETDGALETRAFTVCITQLRKKYSKGRQM